MAIRLPPPKALTIGSLTMVALNLIPAAWAIGGGLALCTAGFFVPLLLPRFRAATGMARAGSAA